MVHPSWALEDDSEIQACQESRNRPLHSAVTHLVLRSVPVSGRNASRQKGSRKTGQVIHAEEDPR